LSFDSSPFAGFWFSFNRFSARLVLGVAAARSTHSGVLVAGIAGLVAGALSMAAGECISVHSQADTEKAELALERAELETPGPGLNQDSLFARLRIP
jgi:VIT1/CCC1 family predicted Fe2+/Mn2+ transporter